MHSYDYERRRFVGLARECCPECEAVEKGVRVYTAGLVGCIE